MPTLNVSLTPELAGLIEDKVASGMYHSASEVVRDGLRLLKDQDDQREAKLENLRNELRKGVESLERGETTTYASGRELTEKIQSEGRHMIAERPTTSSAVYDVTHHTDSGSFATGEAATNESLDESDGAGIDRSKRAKLTAEESLRRMKAFPERKEHIIAALRKSKNRDLPS